MTNKLLMIVSTALAAVFCSSCKGKEDIPEETLLLDKDKIEAVKDLANYKVGITSNASWTVSLVEASGAEITWAVLDRKSGKGNSTLTIRVYENPNKSSRTGILTVRTHGGLSASVTVSQEGDISASDEEEKTLKLRIGTYNMRGSWLKEDKPENAWEVRKDRMLLSIQDCAFDVMGLQEVGSAQQSWLVSTFSSIYSFMFFSPYSQDGTGDKGQGIGWRKDAFTMSNWHYFWLGKEPGVMSRNDTGTSGTFNRGGSCCVLTHKATGLKFFIMNTHGCMNGEPRVEYAPQYEVMEKTYNKDNLPSFFVGDMNSSEDAAPDAPYTVYTSYWKDAYKEVPSNKRTGNGTFNGFSAASGKSRIDMVFFRGGKSISVESYTCKYTQYGCLFASDHFPVFADVTIID